MGIVYTVRMETMGFEPMSTSSSLSLSTCLEEFILAVPLIETPLKKGGGSKNKLTARSQKTHLRSCIIDPTTSLSDFYDRVAFKPLLSFRRLYVVGFLQGATSTCLPNEVTYVKTITSPCINYTHFFEKLFFCPFIFEKLLFVGRCVENMCF